MEAERQTHRAFAPKDGKLEINDSQPEAGLDDMLFWAATLARGAKNESGLLLEHWFHWGKGGAAREDWTLDLSLTNKPILSNNWY